MAGRIENPADLNAVRGQLLGLENYLAVSSLERDLLDLVRMRASQINGCAFCLAMHARDLRQRGEREDRLAVLDAWRETPWFSARERAALGWTEAITTLANHEIPDDLFARVRAEFTEPELADLTLAVIAINGWNRLNIAFQVPPVPFTIDTSRETVIGAEAGS